MIDDWHAADAKDDRPAMERSVEMSCSFLATASHSCHQLPWRHALHVTRQSAKLIDFVTSMGAVACTVAFPDGSWALEILTLQLHSSWWSWMPAAARQQMLLGGGMKPLKKCSLQVSSQNFFLVWQLLGHPENRHGSHLRRLKICERRFQAFPSTLASHCSRTCTKRSCRTGRS